VEPTPFARPPLTAAPTPLTSERRDRSRTGRQAGAAPVPPSQDNRTRPAGRCDDGPAPDAAPLLDELPRRVRQASLAPQLRAQEPAQPAAGDAAREPERDAEEVRNRMASMQRGWQRGRRRNAEDAAAEQADDQTGDGRTVPGSTSEGDGR
jgi:hypothetical protein